MSEKAVMIVNAVLSPEGKEAFAEYSEKSVPLFKNAGAKPLAKHKVKETIVGSKKLQVVSIMEFPDIESVKGVFESEAYKELLPLRDKAFVELDVFIA